VKKGIVNYAKNLPERERFTDAELSQATDHRAILMLRKAMMFDELQTKKPLMQKNYAKHQRWQSLERK